jgi:hypothetical protein
MFSRTEKSGFGAENVASWHKTDLPMQSPHVRCWGNNGSRISVLRLVFRRRRHARMSSAREVLDHPAAKSIVPKSMPQAFDRRAKLF